MEPTGKYLCCFWQIFKWCLDGERNDIDGFSWEKWNPVNIYDAVNIVDGFVTIWLIKPKVLLVCTTVVLGLGILESKCVYGCGRLDTYPNVFLYHLLGLNPE